MLYINYLYVSRDSDAVKVYQDGYCYILEIADCKTLQVAERFTLSLIDIMRTNAMHNESNESANLRNLMQNNPNTANNSNKS